MPGRRFYRRFRIGFTVLVLGGLATGVAIEHARPSRSELPVFAPIEAVEVAPVGLPVGDHTLAGRILDGGGRPVEGVLVELTQDGEPRWAYSDPDGGFAVEGLAAGQVAVALVQPGHPPVVVEATVPGEPVRWTLPARYAPIEGLPEVPRAALYGRITSPFDRPLDEYELILEPTDDAPPLSGLVPRRVRIIPGGLFTLTDLALGDYDVHVLPRWADGGSWPRLSRQRYAHVASAPDMQIVLDAGELDGALRHEDGSPLAGALVTVHDAERPERVWPPRRSGIDGRFRYTDLPPGDYVLELRAGDARLESRVSVRPRQRTTVELGPIAIEPPD